MNRTTTATALGATVLLLAACSGGDRGASGAGGASAAADGRAGALSARGPVAAPRATSASGGTAASRLGGTLVAPSLVVTGSLSISVRSAAAVDTAADRAAALVARAGGRVDADDRSTAPRRTARLVLRVPTAVVPTVEQDLTALGTVVARQQQTQDVTDQVVDVGSRVRSARAAIAGLSRLYARAATVKDLISVETALSARQSDLESLEARQAALSAQTSLATLTLTVTARAAAAPAAHHGGGFVGGLQRGWHAFTTTVAALATALGTVLPFVAVAALLAAGTLTVWRRRSRGAPVTDAD